MCSRVSNRWSKMDLVIRLKRPRNVDPFEALVLASKRRKKDEDTQGTSSEYEPSPTILKFAGTINHQEEDMSPHIFKARERVDLKSLNRLKMNDIRHKVRSDARKASKENRLKVVNMSRTISDVQHEHSYSAPSDSSKSNETSQFTIVDVVHDEGVTEVKDPEVEEDDKYVYSLYFANSAGGEINDGFLESLVSVAPLNTSSAKLFVYNDQSDDDSNPDDEDDSNDENNWRNEYPDSDDDDDRQNSDASVESMMNNIKLGSKNDLSSDDGEGDLPYGVDADEVLNLGKVYATYKSKVMKELEDDVDEYASEVVSSQSDDDS